MTTKRKRAIGGGRKSTGPFSNLTSPLSIRMPTDMRKTLEAAALANGTSLGQEVLRRVQRSFREDREKDHHPATRAFCFLIAKLARDVVGFWDADGRPSYEWRSDPFFFCAFKVAIARLLDAMAPQGEPRPPSLTVDQQSGAQSPEFLKSFNSAEARGEYAANIRWSLLLHTDPKSDLDWLSFYPELKDQVQREYYGLKDARDALHIKALGEKL